MIRKKEKIAIAYLFIFILVSVSLLGLTDTGKAKDKDCDNDKLQVITTLFPQYDFVREIGGDKVDVTLLLPAGMEAHSYEPTPKDIIRIHNADLFVYTGEEMEEWAAKILAGMDENTVKVVDLSQCVELALMEEVEAQAELYKEEVNETANLETANHETANHEEAEQEHTHYAHDGHHHTYDPHIWTSPANAMKMVELITQQLMEADPSNATYYQNNATKYLQKLYDIDEQIRQVVEQSEKDTIYFGGRFALHYFFEEYGLKYIAAYDSCGEHAEPNAKRISTIIETMKQTGNDVIFYEELVDPKAARIISEETDARVLLFHSCHNVTVDEMKDGATYISLMEQNLEHLKQALQ